MSFHIFDHNHCIKYYRIRRQWSKRTYLKTVVTIKQSTQNFSKSKYLLPPDTHTHMGVSVGKKLFGEFGELYFLVTPVLRFTFLPYYRGTKWVAIELSSVFKHFRLLKITWDKIIPLANCGKYNHYKVHQV